MHRAVDLGAGHADARLVNTRNGAMSVRDGRLEASIDQQGSGIGVRVIVDGCWGFASSDIVTADEAAALADRAVAMARISRALTTREVELAPEPVHIGHWESPYEIDPFDVPEAERVELLRERSRELLADSRVKHVDARLLAVREAVDYADSAGTRT